MAVDTITTAQPDKQVRHVMRGAFAGFFLDMFDIYLPVLVLAPALGYFVSPTLPPATQALVANLIFVSTLIGRPVGALIFGHYADRFSRKRATIVSITGFGALTILIALSPGYAQWGSGALVLFVALRFITGVFVGGEYTSASPLVMEHSARTRRGINSGLIMAGFPLAYVTISAITLAMLHIAPAGSLHSPYVQWGWRIPFLLGGLLAFAAVRYFARHVQEPTAAVRHSGGKAPLAQLLSRAGSVRDFAQVFVLMTGFWLALDAVSAILPGLLKSPHFGLSGTRTSTVLIISFAFAALGYVSAGVLSQRVGRRRFLIIWGLLAATAGTLAYYLLLTHARSGLPVIAVLTTVTVLLLTSQWGIAIAYVSERFHAGVRASGFGLGYSLAVILPSFYAVYQDRLGAIMNSTYTVLPLVAAGGLLITIGACLGPETTGVDFTAE